MSRFLAFAAAISVVLTACIGTDAKTTVATAQTTDTTQPTSVTEGVVVTPPLLPQVEMERVAHGPWFEGSVWMTSVTVGGPGLVAAGAQGDLDWLHTDAAVWTSSDGHHWVRVDHDPAVFGDESAEAEAEGDQEIADLASGSLGVVAVGSDDRLGDSDAAVWLSTDGLAWERLPHDEEVFGGEGNQVMRSVVQMSDAAVTVGESAGHAAAWVSNDGSEWTRAQIDGAPGGTGPEPTAMSDVALGSPGLVAVGSVGFESRPAVWVSADGTTWSRLPDSIAGGSSGVEGGESTVGQMTLVAAGDKGLVAIGATKAGPVVWTSNDGFEWHMLEATFMEAPTASQFDYLKSTAPVSLRDVAWDGDRLVAVGGYDTLQTAGMMPRFVTLWVSVDGGLTWQVGSEQTLAPDESQSPRGATRLTRFGSSFVAVGFDAIPAGENSQGWMQYASTAAVWVASVTEG